MAIKPLVRKLLKVAGIAMGILLAVLLVAYGWFVHHAESIIREIVASRSNGTVDLTLKNITYDFSNRRLNLKEAVIFNTDSASKKTAYRITVKKLSLQLHTLTPLLFQRRLVIDSLLINEPAISVMKADTLESKRGSLAHEIGDLYHSIQQALNLFQIDHFRITNGRFSLDNRGRSDWQPVTLSHIYFAINHIRVGSSEEDTALHFTDDIEFRTDHQVVTFPDRRYRMAFAHFSIQVKDRTISLDSCSINTTGEGQQPVDLHLFFDKLRFSNIDFLTLYSDGVINADSMYATNPVLNLRVKVDSVRQQPQAPPVSIDSLLHHLGVNTRLRYMGVKNVSTTVVTEHPTGAATFKTSGDDFEMRDLEIDRHAPQPVKVGRFDMAIRGYTSLNKDSTYRFKFDSIRIVNSNILLNNFSINSLHGAAVVRHHQLPLLELDSLSWEELIFNRHVQAKQAILYRPEIRYVKMAPDRNRSRTSLYPLLSSIDKIMSLERIRIIDGNVSFEPKADTKLLLQQVDVTVQTNQFLAARNTMMIGDAVDSLHFKTGSFQTPKMQATITNGSFTGNGTQLQAAEATIRNRTGNMTIEAKGLQLSAIWFNDTSSHADIGLVGWKEASIAVHTQPADPASSRPLRFTWLARQVEGRNTQLRLQTPNSTLNTFITRLSLRDLTRDEGTKFKSSAVIIEGRHLQFNSKDLRCNTGDYALHDRAHSYVNNLRLTHYTPRDSLTASIPTITLLPNLVAILQGQLQADQVMLLSPAIWAKLGPAAAAAPPRQPGKPLPILQVAQLTLVQPLLQVEQLKDSQHLRLQWNRGNEPAGNQWVIHDIRHDGKSPLTIEKVNVTGTAVSFERHATKTLVLKPQSIQLVLTNTKLTPGHKELVPWSTLISHFAIRNLEIDGIGKDSGKLSLASLTLEHLALQAHQKPRQWLDNSPQLHLRDLSGSLVTAKNDLQWKGMRYHHAQQLLSIDSFSYRPVLDRDAYVKAHPWQIDYIRLTTGKIDLYRLNWHSLLEDTLVHLSGVTLKSPHISVFRDKRPPHQPNIIRPLPVDQIKGLPFRLKLDSLQIEDGTVQYEELNEKTNKSGIIPIARLNASLVNVKSFGHDDSDSLKLQARATLFDSIALSLRLHESYTDTLAAFLMTTRVGPANLLLLNSAVEPLASVRIRSGHLDTLTLRAIGREYISYGEMHMLYRDLNVQFLQSGDAEKKTFMTKLITFFANAFVIKNRNRGNTGIIYFERLRDRSVFNYMIKMLLSGAGTSIGAKSNRKYLKQYKRELRRQQLPPIEYH